MGILAMLFNLLIFSLPLGVTIRVTLFPSFSVYPHDIIVLLILIMSFAKFILDKDKIEQKKLFFLALAFLSIGLSSLFINSAYLGISNFLVAIAYLVRYAAYINIIFAAQFLDNKFRESVSMKLIISGLIFTFFGYVQYFFYPSLRNLFYAGWDEHLYRLFSTFLDPNFAGTFLVLIMLLLFGNIIKLFRGKSLKLIFFMLASFFVLVAILLTYSRSAFVTLLIGLVGLLTVHRNYKVLVSLVFLLIVLFFLFSNYSIEGLNPFRVVSSEARIQSAQEAFDIFSRNPILGVGFNAYRYAQIRYGFREEKGALVSNADAGTDNSYLFVLATTGVMGFFLFLDLWINILKEIYKRLKDKSAYAEVAFASVLSLLVNTIFINSLFYAPIIAWTFVLIGITVNRKR